MEPGSDPEFSPFFSVVKVEIGQGPGIGGGSSLSQHRAGSGTRLQCRPV